MEKPVRSIVICKICEKELRGDMVPNAAVFKVNIHLDVCLECIQQEYSKIKPKV